MKCTVSTKGPGMATRFMLTLTLTLTLLILYPSTLNLTEYNDDITFSQARLLFPSNVFQMRFSTSDNGLLSRAFSAAV